MKARLILENGMILEGNAFGYLKDSVGEVVFTTGMTGYQEVLTDPSYYGQIVTMTYPLIGNYGINLEDNESDTPKVRGFIVREKCSFPNNFRCEIGLEDYLKQNKIIGLEGIDTRALTKVLRNNGTMRGIISLEHETLEEVKEKGVIFLDIDSGLREYPEIFKKYFDTVIPYNDNKFSALNGAVWSGGSFIYVPPGVKLDKPLQSYCRINR